MRRCDALDTQAVIFQPWTERLLQGTLGLLARGGQLLSIGLVVATAVTTLVSLRGTYEALVSARAEYYREYGMADVWSALEQDARERNASPAVP